MGSEMCIRDRYKWYTSLPFLQDRSTNHRKLFETPRRYGPSYLLTTSTIVDGDRVETIMPSTLLLAVPYLALAQVVLFHTVSSLTPVLKIDRRFVNEI